MKCIRILSTSQVLKPEDVGQVYRVENDLADLFVHNGDAEYTPKKAWKETGRKPF